MIISIMNKNNSWAYLGKESYGSRHVARNSLKPGSKFFDALGRAYDKMKAKIKYYIFKDAVEREEFDVSFEFEVYARIIKDSEGNDIQVFVKEDKARGLRRDSSFYWDGSWEVFDFDDLAKETRFRTSSGYRSLRKYDDTGHLKERNMIDSNGDTLTSEWYEWENNRLIRMTANGVVRNYIYGKTLQDTVYVEPSDEGFNYHSGYNGTAGKIPEGTFEYKIFAMNPYGHAHFGYEEEPPEDYFVPEKFSSSLNILAKSVTRGCVSEETGMPRAQCIRLNKRDIPINANRNFGYSHRSRRDTITYGYADAELSINYKCECNASGKYRPSFSGKAINEILEVIKSIWRYDEPTNDWYEYCWNRRDLQNTYWHEVRHINNGREAAKTIVESTSFLRIAFDTKEKCESDAKREYEFTIEILMEKWNKWYDMEKLHANPNSPPASGGFRDEIYCN